MRERAARRPASQGAVVLDMPAGRGTISPDQRQVMEPWPGADGADDGIEGREACLPSEGANQREGEAVGCIGAGVATESASGGLS